MLRKWTWLVPCWLWLWAFKTSGVDLVTLGDKRREAIRIDEDFILVRDPLPPRARTPRSVEAQQRREAKLRKKREKLKRKLGYVDSSLKIEEQDDLDDEFD